MISILRKMSRRFWIGTGAGIIIAAVFFALYHSFVTLNSCKSPEERCEMSFSRNMMVDLDNLSSEDNTYSMSEKIEIIRAQQQLVLNREDQLVEDFRQEMNNNINKMNTWVAFAVGIMSLTGIIIPIIVQINLVKENDESIKKLTTKVIQKRNKLIKDGNDKIKEIDDNFKVAKSEFEKDQHLQHLLVNFLSFKHGCEDNILQNQSDRDLLMRHVWCKADDSFEKVVADCLKDDEHQEGSRATLLISLIMMHSMIEKLKCSTSSRRVRELDSISDHIKGICTEIELGQRNDIAWESIKTKLKTLSQEIQNLSSLFN